MISGKADKFPLIELRELEAKTIINLADSPDIKNSQGWHPARRAVCHHLGK